MHRSGAITTDSSFHPACLIPCSMSLRASGNKPMKLARKRHFDVIAALPQQPVPGLWCAPGLWTNTGELRALQPGGEPGTWRLTGDSDDWFVAVDAAMSSCIACQLNHTIPDLNDLDNQRYWNETEAAKRQLVSQRFCQAECRSPIM